MARRRRGDDAVKPDLTPLIDVVFQLIAFFVMLMTIAKDEQAQKIKLPLAPNADELKDDQIPDSLNINVDSRGHMLSWGDDMDISSPEAPGWNRFAKLIGDEAKFARQAAQAAGKDYKKEGLSTTLIMRFDKEVQFDIFRGVLDKCHELNFNKYQLKAGSEDDQKK